MKTLAWNDGHTLRGKGTGAVGIIKETDRNRSIGARARAILESEYIVNIINCTVDESANDMKEMVDKANNAKADAFISNHVNAGGGVGIEGFYSCRNKNQDSIDRGRTIYNELVHTKSCLNARRYCDDKSYKGFELYVLKNTNMEAFLFEIGFVDNQRDVDAINEEEIAQAYARGIAKAYNLDKKVKKIDFPIAMFGHIQGGEDQRASGVNQCSIGTRNQALRLEALQINIDGIDFEYMVHLQGYCDTPFVPRGFMLGSMNLGLRIEGFQLNVKSIPDGYKLQYRVNLQGIGLTEWVDAGTFAGTRGESRRLEYVEIRIVSI